MLEFGFFWFPITFCQIAVIGPWASPKNHIFPRSEGDDDGVLPPNERTNEAFQSSANNGMEVVPDELRRVDFQLSELTSVILIS